MAPERHQRFVKNIVHLQKQENSFDLYLVKGVSFPEISYELKNAPDRNILSVKDEQVQI